MRYKGTISVEEVNGSAGSVTGARAKGVPYLKNKPIPTNPRTTRQQTVRGAFGTNAKDFSALPYETAKQWNEAAKGKFGRQVFGIKAGISGINLFVQTNQNIVEAGGNPVSDVPQPSEIEMPILNILGITGYSFVEQTEGSSSQIAAIVVDKMTLPANLKIVARTTGKIFGNKVYVKNKLRVFDNNAQIVQVLASAEGNTFKKDVTLITFNWVNWDRAQLPTTDDRTAFEVYFINPTTGERSVPYYVDATVKLLVAKEVPA